MQTIADKEEEETHSDPDEREPVRDDEWEPVSHDEASFNLDDWEPANDEDKADDVQTKEMGDKYNLDIDAEKKLRMLRIGSSLHEPTH
jgi:hypothetical protein